MSKSDELRKLQLKSKVVDATNYQNDDKIKKAQALYEPWMDYQAQTPSVHDYTESPPKFGKPKERSQFKFDKNYLNEFSNTPSPVINRVTQNSTYSKQVQQTTNTKKGSTPILSVPSRRPSSEITIKLPESTRNRRTPTPLPTYNELESMKKDQKQHSNISRKNSNNIKKMEMSTQTSTSAIPNFNEKQDHYKRKTSDKLNHLKRDSVAHNELQRNIGILAIPTTTSIATSPFEFEIDNEDYTEFYAWLMNGNEHDIDPKLIERLLFHARKRINQLII